MTNEPEANPFEGMAPLQGLEHLGRAIVDADGVPSGSPANFEALRGQTGTPDAESETVADVQTLLDEHRAAMLAELAVPPAEPPAPPDAPPA